MNGYAPSSAFMRLIEALESHGCLVGGGGRQRNARCPAHDDDRPSLSITDGESRVLVKCHGGKEGGCDTDDVLAVLGLARRDMFDMPRERGSGEWTPWISRCPCPPVAHYPYTDEYGNPLYEVVRGTHKEFAQRRPDPTARSGWRWSLGDVRRVLYHLPQLLAAPDSACVFLPEGEKDVHALEAAGEIATTNQQGAGDWREEYARFLVGRDVLVIADRDEPGREHAWHVLNSIRPVVRSAWIVQAATGKDAADHLAAGLSVCDLVWWTL